MEAINSGIVDITLILLLLKKLFLGTVAVGFFFGGIYFAYYLIKIYKMPR